MKLIDSNNHSTNAEQREFTMMARKDAALGTLTITQQLVSAIEHGEFELYYQPLIDVRDQSICGVEALIRWNHPERGLLHPAEFVQAAEATGLIVAIGSWVLGRACTDLRCLRQSSRSDLLLSVNVSSRQLDEPAFLSDLSAIIQRTGIAPQLLQLEITESIFLRDSLRIGTLFQAIRALGVKIAFDDFGTGYSCLSYLEKYPVDVVKIDQYFVQRMGRGSVNADIVRMIVRLAHSAGMSVSAEGVENGEQAAVLSGLGCNIAQGYLYSQPVSLNDMSSMMEHRYCCSLAAIRLKTVRTKEIEHRTGRDCRGIRVGLGCQRH